MAQNPCKVLACGDVNGKFQSFFKRIKSVNSKAGPFELILCVGDFFGSKPLTPENEEIWNDLKAGKTTVPAPIHLLGPVHENQSHYFADIEGCELATDIIYLGKIGLLTTSQGLKLAYISPNVSFDAVKSLEVKSNCDYGDFQGVDILMSSEWPLGLGSGDDQVPKDEGNSHISRLAVKLRPRYALNTDLRFKFH